MKLEMFEELDVNEQMRLTGGDDCNNYGEFWMKLFNGLSNLFK